MVIRAEFWRCPANGAELASGIVWAATYDPQRDLEEGALHLIKPGILRAYAADDVTKQLWTSESDEDPFGSFAKFNPPTVANGRVYIATFGGSLRVYGLLEYPYLRPGEIHLPAKQAGGWRPWHPCTATSRQATLQRGVGGLGKPVR